MSGAGAEQGRSRAQQEKRNPNKGTSTHAKTIRKGDEAAGSQSSKHTNDIVTHNGFSSQLETEKQNQV